MTGVKVHVDHFCIVTAFEPSPAGTAQNPAYFLIRIMIGLIQFLCHKFLNGSSSVIINIY